MTFGLAARALPALFALLWTCELAAQTRRDPPDDLGRGPRLALASTVDLEPLSVAELLPGHGAGPFVFHGDDIGLVRPATRLVRALPSLWRLALPRGRQPAALQVSYELRGLDGRRDALSASGGSGAFARVELQPIGPRELSRSTSARVVEGGVVLQIDIGDIVRAGDYRGLLTVVVNRL